MKIRAKMECQAVTRTTYNEQVKLFAVQGGTNPADNTFAKATPFACLDISVDNPGALGLFQPGQQYYVDITPAN